MVLHHSDWFWCQNMWIQSHFCNLIWYLMSTAQIGENTLKNFIITKVPRTSWIFFGGCVGSKDFQKADRIIQTWSRVIVMPRWRSQKVNSTLLWKKSKNGHFWPPGQKIGRNHEHRPNLVHFWWLKVILIVVSFLGQKWGFSAVLAHFGHFGPFIGPKSKKTCFIPFIYALGSPHKEEFKICDFWVVGSYSS